MNDTDNGSPGAPRIAGLARTVCERPHGWPDAAKRRHRPVRLSVVVPAYNEEATIADVLEDLLLLQVPCEMEVVVVDDGSSDNTAGILAAIHHPRLRVIRHERNRGKGSALMTGMMAATGTHLLPFDADSEYDAGDVPRLLEPVIRLRADVVYGARIPGMNTIFSSCWYPVGSWLTTWVANALFSSRLKDLHTCLKLVPLQIARDMALREAGFGMDTEVTARLLKMGLRPLEVPVSYHGRSRAEGKKIRWWDGIKCLAVLLRVRLSRSAPSAPPSGYRSPRSFQVTARIAATAAAGHMVAADVVAAAEGH
jgi:glycosyltransferase involved in cell wall biosynthesis